MKKKHINSGILGVNKKQKIFMLSGTILGIIVALILSYSKNKLSSVEFTIEINDPILRGLEIHTFPSISNLIKETKIYNKTIPFSLERSIPNDIYKAKFESNQNIKTIHDYLKSKIINDLNEIESNFDIVNFDERMDEFFQDNNKVHKILYLTNKNDLSEYRQKINTKDIGKKIEINFSKVKEIYPQYVFFSLIGLVYGLLLTFLLITFERSLIKERKKTK